MIFSWPPSTLFIFIFPTSFLHQYILFLNCFMLFLVNISYLFFFPALRLFLFSFPFIYFYLFIYLFIIFVFFLSIYFSSFKNKTIPWTSTAAFYKRLVERQGRRYCFILERREINWKEKNKNKLINKENK